MVSPYLTRPIRTQAEVYALRDAKKVAQHLLNDDTARLTVTSPAIARQRLLAQTSDQAGRSLDAFLKSPLGKKSEQK